MKEKAKKDLREDWIKEHEHNKGSPSTGFADAAKVLRPNPKPNKEDKKIPHKLRS